jgi:hypothetical protein
MPLQHCAIDRIKTSMSQYRVSARSWLGPDDDTWCRGGESFDELRTGNCVMSTSLMVFVGYVLVID